MTSIIPNWIDLMLIIGITSLILTIIQIIAEDIHKNKKSTSIMQKDKKDIEEEKSIIA